MSASLPPRPSLEWLRKLAKRRLAELRRTQPAARLADAQLAIAREYGFPSWRKLKVHVEGIIGTTPDAVGDIVALFLRRVAAGQAREVRAMLDAAPTLVNAVGPHPYWGGRVQALHVAVTGSRETFDLLLERGADVNGYNEEYDHWSPLMVAAGSPEVRDELLRRGARVGLAEALLLQDDARVDDLLRREGLPARVPSDGSFLAFARSTFSIDRLVEAGASIDAKDRWGLTPIEALSHVDGQGEVLVRHLMGRGAVPSPAEFARLGDLGTLARLVTADPTIARREEVMIAAVDGKQHGVVRWLLERGANPNARTGAPSRHTALHAAAWGGDLEMAKLLLAAGADHRVRDEQYDSTPWDWADTAIEVTRNPACAEVATHLAKLED